MTTDPWGIDVNYQDAAGVTQQVSEETLTVMRSAIGPRREAGQSWLAERVKVVRQGESVSVPSPCELTLEDGTSLQIRDQLPETLPIGYHWLTPSQAPSTRVRLIVSPGQCHFPDNLRIWGWNAQLYAVRSRESWGMGDLADLRRLTQWAEGLGAGLVLINPLRRCPSGLAARGQPVLSLQPTVPQSPLPADRRASWCGRAWP